MNLFDELGHSLEYEDLCPALDMLWMREEGDKIGLNESRKRLLSEIGATASGSLSDGSM